MRPTNTLLRIILGAPAPTKESVWPSPYQQTVTPPLPDVTAPSDEPRKALPTPIPE